MRCAAALILLAGGLAAEGVRAQDAGGTAPAPVPMRPTIMFNRWQEDWSVLANPAVPPEPLDGLKYIPLSSFDPQTYLSFGANVRERYEGNSAPGFGVGGNHSQNYVISRTELHADLHLGPHFETVVQVQSDFAPWKSRISPADQDRLDLEQAFAVLTEPVGDGTLKIRLGRQQFAFDLQRFVSVRDGPNVRQSYDAGWIDYEIGPWRLIGLYSRPVQYQDITIFDDYSSHDQTFSMLRVERQLSATNSLSAYWAHYTQAGARYASVAGNERRENFDVHMAGAGGGFDWDVETMGQFGRVGTQSVLAWGVGSLGGYTFKDAFWSPRIGLQVDAASGDSNPHDGTLGTFNPLFPNGAYITLAGYTGYVNFVQVKPSITVHPAGNLKLMLAVAPQWRETTADAVYTQPSIAVPNTAGHGGSYTGTYGQARLDWTVSRSTSFAVEAVHFQVGDAIRRVGGHNGDYAGVQVAFGW